jgi:nucleolin
LFVGGLSFAVDSSWLSDELLRLLDATDASLIESVRVARNPMGKSKGFAFVVLSDKADAQRLAELSDRALAQDSESGALEIDGRPITLAISASVPKTRLTSPGASGPRDGGDAAAARPRNPPTTTLWFGNLPWSTTDSDIEQALSPFFPDSEDGAPKRISLPTDSETGRARGIAYVEFETVSIAKDVMKRLDSDIQQSGGFVLEGRNVRVDYAPEKKMGGGPRRGAGGRAGGGFRGGRDGGERRGYDRRGGAGRGRRDESW